MGSEIIYTMIVTDLGNDWREQREGIEALNNLAFEVRGDKSYCVYSDRIENVYAVYVAKISDHHRTIIKDLGYMCCKLHVTKRDKKTFKKVRY